MSRSSTRLICHKIQSLFFQLQIRIQAHLQSVRIRQHQQRPPKAPSRPFGDLDKEYYKCHVGEQLYVFHIPGGGRSDHTPDRNDGDILFSASYGFLGEFREKSWYDSGEWGFRARPRD